MITVEHKPVFHQRRPANRWRCRLIRAGVCATLLTTALVATVAAALEPAQGTLLIASPEMRGTWFARSVILLVQHDEDGTVGLVINRPTGIAPVELLPDIEDLSLLRSTLYIGGPVEGHGVMMLVRSDRPPTDAEHVFADVYASGSIALLQEVAREGGSPQRLRLYAGYAGWVPGQLEAEIHRGSWTVVPAVPEYVFSGDPDGIWERLKPVSEPIIVMRGAPAPRF